MKITLSFLVILSFCISSHADIPNNKDSGIFSSNDLKQLDENLNKRYQRLIKLLDEDGKNSLKKAQINWINFRDSTCEFEKQHLTESSWYSDGTKGETKISCLARITKDRLYELNKFIELSENNTSPLTLDSSIAKSFNLISRRNGSSRELSDVFDWIDDLTLTVKGLTNKDFSSLTNKYRNIELHYASENVASSGEKINLNKDGQPTFVSNQLLLKTGNCNISYAKNSIIICTGDLHISHTSSSIIIANGKIDISHDGANGSGSLLINSENVDISSSQGTVFIFSKFVKASQIRNSDCINTGGVSASRGNCYQIKSKDIQI